LDDVVTNGGGNVGWIIAHFADSPDDIAACVEATLKFAYNTYRPTATLIGQRVIGAKTFGKD
jgi:hypothetical protein